MLMISKICFYLFNIKKIDILNKNEISQNDQSVLKTNNDIIIENAHK